MTATVKRGAGRPAATAKSNRHAQRTLLPPRPGTVRDAQDAIAEAQGTAKGAATAVLARASKSEPKAKAFAASVEAHGWTARIESAPGSEPAEDSIEVTATRGTEVLWIGWTRGTLMTEPMPSYTIADRTVRMRNASQCKQYAERTPDAASQELTKVQANRAFVKRDRTPKRSRLPFDPGLALDEEVLTAISGRTVVWRNSRSGNSEEAVVSPLRKPEIVEHEGDRIVKFLCPNTGFRAFRLAALERVGRAVKVESVSAKRSNKKAKAA